jgi:hypothetical protein
MRYILIFITALFLLGQTRINLESQAKNSNIAPNGYFNTVHWTDGRVTFVPGPYFGSLISGVGWIPPRSSNDKCGVKHDGVSRPPYEFALIGMQFSHENYIYICTVDKRWKRFRVEEF